jgi:CRP-like cAMP-binding protein
MKRVQHSLGNRLLSALSPADLALLEPFETFSLEREEVLFEPGDDVVNVYFPTPGMIASFVMDLRDGITAEAAMVGQEGALGGIISQGHKPAYARATVQIGGRALRISTDVLDAAKQRSPALRDHFARYADCLLAQILQTVGCTAVHDYEARLARWLLTLQDRMEGTRLPVTHQLISEMLGVRRSYTTKVVGGLERAGAIQAGRGFVEITDRAQLERRTCECYGYLRRHYERLLPGVYPASAP